MFQAHQIPNWVSWIVLILSIPFWFYAYLYLDSVMPDTYGISKHPCFCCKSKKHVSEAVENEKLIGIDPRVFDNKDPILIENLTKKFGNFTAVNHLSMSIKENEIFTILGHNGAGKTTVIYMLTGILKPSSGDAIVYGDPISTNLDNVQQNLGLC
jgi:ABC-type multidrug transport system fused ATPase/permease subunit